MIIDTEHKLHRGTTRIQGKKENIENGWRRGNQKYIERGKGT